MIRKWFISIFLLAVLSSLIGLPIFASTTTSAKYSGIITITNNGTATSNVIVPVSINTTALIANSMLNSSVTDSAVLSNAIDVPYMPQYGTSNWWLWVSSIGASSSIPDNIYTGNGTSMSSKLRYFPDTGGMATIDNNATLELGGNFTIEQKGRIDTTAGANKNFVIKSGAITENITASGNITGMVTGLTGLSQTLTPNGAGDFTQQTTLVGAATNWQANLTNDGDTSYSGTGEAAGGVTLRDTYTMTDGTIPSYAVIDSVTVVAYAKYFATSALNTITLTVRLSSTNVDSGSQSLTNTYDSHSAALARPGGGSWTPSDIPNIQAGAILHEEITGEARCTQVSVTVAYHYSDTVASASGISSGEHANNITADGVLLSVHNDTRTSVTPISTNLTLNLPLWSSSMQGTALISVDANRYSTNVSGATWGSQGRTLSAGNYISTNHTASLMSQTEFAMSLWVKFSTVTASQTLYAKYNTYNQDGFYIDYAYSAPNGELDFVFGNGGGIPRTFSTNNPFVAGTWYNIQIIRRAGATTGEMYANTVNIRSGQTGGDFSNVVSNTAPVVIGNGPAFNRTFTGVIGEVQYYDRAPSVVELTANYNATKWKYDGSTDSYEYSALNNSVINNSSGWTFLQNGIMPYMEYQKIWVGGNLRQNISYQYAPIFTDQSGNGNDATPTYPTSSSDADVSAVLSSLSPISTAQITTFSITTAGSILSGNATMPSQMYTSGNYTKIPGAEVINTFLDEGGIPRALWWYPFIFGSIIVIGLLFYSLTSGGNRSVLMQCVITEILLILVGIINPVPLVGAFLFPIAAFAIISSQKHTTLG